MLDFRSRWLRVLLVLLGCCSTGCGLVRNVIQNDRRSSNGLPDFTHRVGAWRTEAVRMRDGVELATHILLPEGVERAPVVLIRNPYDLGPFLELSCDLFVRYGMGCVLQDVRGRLDSGGQWWPFMNENADGEDTLRWLVRQPFVDGKVALYGMSYLGGTALAAAAGELPVEVKTVVVTVFGTDLREVVSERGLLPHELLTAWAAYMPGREPTRGMKKAYRMMLEHRPHLEADVATFGAPIPWYREWLASQVPGEGLWRRPEPEALRQVAGRLPVPMLLVGGFDDPFLTATLRTWESLASRERSLMVLGPWNHLGTQSGALKTAGVKDDLHQWQITIPWLRHVLQGVPLPYATGRVHVAGHGDDGFRVLPTWPLPSREQVLFLGATPAGGAPGACASTSLSDQPPAIPASLTYRYDPLDPWRSEGGSRGIAFALVGRGTGVTPGPVKQTWPCARKDVLRFVGPAAESDMRIAGRARLRLRVRSSAEDTAFVAKLIDVDADGRALHVTDGAATLRLPLADASTPVPYAPGSEREVEIDFFPTSWVLAKGHRLGLWVSSSSYPMLSAHLNTARPWFEETTPVVAAQTVELGGEAASRLLLPIELQ